MFVDFQYKNNIIALNLDKIIQVKCDFKESSLYIQTEFNANVEDFYFYFKDVDSLKTAYNRIFNKRLYDTSMRVSITEDLGLIEQKRSKKK